jgi:threonine/homoserine/homoserine lactone efflux protein
LIGSTDWPYYRTTDDEEQPTHVLHPAAFLTLSALVIVTPGPDTALTIRNTLRAGRPAGVGTACGVVGGHLVWITASVAGVAALVAASGAATGTIRVVGGVYLVYLGLSTLARRPEAGGVPSTRRSAAAQGLASNLSNPKAALFFASLLPQFAREQSAVTMVALGGAFAAMTFSWLCLYACVLTRFRRALERGALRRALDVVAGSSLVGFGLVLALGERL